MRGPSWRGRSRRSRGDDEHRATVRAVACVDLRSGHSIARRSSAWCCPRSRICSTSAERMPMSRDWCGSAPIGVSGRRWPSASLGDAARDREGHALSLGTRTLLFVVLLLVLVTAAQSADVVSHLWQGPWRVAGNQGRPPVAALDAHRGSAGGFLPGGGVVQDQRRSDADADSGDDGRRGCVRGGALHRRHVRRATNQSVISHVRVQHAPASRSRTCRHAC